MIKDLLSKFVFSMLLCAYLTHSIYTDAALQISNPLATKDQIELDTLASTIYHKHSFLLLRSMATIIYQFAHLKSVTAGSKKWLTPAIDELIFSAIQKAVNSDPYHPKVYWVDTAAHSWPNLAVPGGRYAYDNPDVIYRIIPIDGNLHYIVHGQRFSQLADVAFSLIKNPNSQETIQILTGNDLILNPDGSYDITIDNQPAQGRINHIQSTSEASQLFIRNTLGDWQSSLPDALTVVLLDDSSKHPPISEREIVKKASKNIQESIFYYGVGALAIKTMLNNVNTLAPPSMNSQGTLVTQFNTFGHYQLDDDLALIITIHPGGANYFIVPASNPWMLTINPGETLCSLNNTQSVANADGLYRFVLSEKDPGVHNWISTAGLDEGTLMLRWQDLPSEGAKPDVSIEVVALSELPKKLPRDTVWVTPEYRLKQLAERAKAYAKRNQF